MMTFEMKLQRFTKLLNRYFRTTDIIYDWSYIYKQNSIVVQVDYVNNRHLLQEVTFILLDNLKVDNFDSFVKDLYGYFLKVELEYGKE